MLGWLLFLSFSQAMPNATFPKTAARLALLAGLLLILPMLARVSRAQGVHPPASKAAPSRALTPGGEATLEADQQREVGKMFYADGHVDVRYENARLRADHVEYDSEAQVVVARGHVQLDYLTQHVEADDARYELRTAAAFSITCTARSNPAAAAAYAARWVRTRCISRQRWPSGSIRIRIAFTTHG